MKLCNKLISNPDPTENDFILKPSNARLPHHTQARKDNKNLDPQRHVKYVFVAFSQDPRSVNLSKAISPRHAGIEERILNQRIFVA